MFGLVVDHASEVVEFSSWDIHPPANFGVESAPGSVLGIGVGQGAAKVLLDIEHVFSSAQLMCTQV